MKIKEDRIDAIAKQYNISYAEVMGILYSSIATIYNAEYASIIDDKIIVGVLERGKITTKVKRPSKRAVYNILKEFKKQLELKAFENNFFMFFSKNRFYKAKPLKVVDNRIYIEILGVDKAKLYNFFLYVKDLNYNSFLKIREQTFFAEDNIFYVNILKPTDKKNILCSNFNKDLIRMLFFDAYGFLKKKFNRQYELENLGVKTDIFTKQSEIFCKFKMGKEASRKFVGVLNRILNKKTGRVRVYLSKQEKIKIWGIWKVKKGYFGK